MRKLDQNKMSGGSKGFVLITSYLFIASLLTFTLGLYTYHLTFVSTSERNQNRIIGFHMAEAGLDRAIGALKTASRATLSDTGNDDSFGTSYTPLGNRGGYSVTVTSPDPLNSMTKQIVTRGFSPSNDPSTRAYETRTVVAFATNDDTPFDNAIFANGEIEFNGTTVESYGGASLASEGAHVRTNATEEGSIQLKGQTTINGDVTVGPGLSDPMTAIEVAQPARITGSVSSAPSDTTYPPASTTLASQGKLKCLNAATCQPLAAGTYHFDEIKISGNAQLVLTGKVEIYVSGEVDIGGRGVVNTEMKPSNFLLYATGGEDIKITGATTFFGGIYAPRSEVEFSDRAFSFFGAVIADEFKSNSGNVYYDETMKYATVSGTEPKIVVQSWRETTDLSVPTRSTGTGGVPAGSPSVVPGSASTPGSVPASASILKPPQRAK